MDRKLAERYFMDRTSPEEDRKVLEWFDTPEGKRYLQHRLDTQSGLWDQYGLQKDEATELDSEKLYRTIERSIYAGRRDAQAKRDLTGITLKMAASICVILFASFFYLTVQSNSQEILAGAEPLYFQTLDEQHHEISLLDGTRVRMNSNSEITIPVDYMQGMREITLNGEAYFEVKYNPELPFLIHANQSVIEVLGTSFNVKSVAGKETVQVAVVDGKVALRSLNSLGSEIGDVTLEKGQYGYLDHENQLLHVDDIAVENYLAWKNGRLRFEQLRLNQVCTQLSRLYRVECEFENDELGNLHLTANFSNDSIEKTLSVIALTLKIDYKMDGEAVYWFHTS